MSVAAYTKAGKRAYRAEFEFQGQRVTRAGFRTLEDARDWISAERKRLKVEAKNPQPTPTAKLMFSVASAKYLADCKARMQPGTFDEKYRHLTDFAEYLGENIPVSSISDYSPEDFIAAVQRRITNKTANRYLRTLKAFWNWTAKRNAVGENPFFSIEPYPEDEAPIYVPSTEDVIAILSVAEDWERDFLNVLVKTGARPGEVRLLTWDDVDFSRGTITLWTRKRKGGTRQPRTLNMSEQLAEALKGLFEDRKNETYVFVNQETGEPFTRQSRPYKFLMERLCRRANEERKEKDPESKDMKPFTFYSFRHFVATRLRDSGKASRYEVQHILGHQRSDTTDRYLRSLVPELQEAVDALDEVINLNDLPHPEAKKKGKVIKLARA